MNHMVFIINLSFYDDGDYGNGYIPFIDDDLDQDDDDDAHHHYHQYHYNYHQYHHHHLCSSLTILFITQQVLALG